MRKILISSGFGAGWVSWYNGTTEQKRFMLEYIPFIEFLETNKCKVLDEDHLLVEQFKKDWVENFPNTELPYFGGLSTLSVYQVLDNVRVHIEEYDGNESVLTENDMVEWL